MSSFVSISLFAVFILFSTQGHAQLGGFLKDLKTLTDQAKQGQLGQPSQDTSNQAPNAVTSTSKATANTNARNLINTYCERVNSSDFIIRVIELNKKIAAADGPATLDNYFATSENKIRSWVSEKTKGNFNLEIGPGYPKSDGRIKTLIDTINKCYSESTDKPINTLAKIWWGSGNISQPFSPNTLSGEYITLNLSTKSSLILFAYLFDDADSFFSKLQPDLITKMNEELTSRLASAERRKNEKAEEEKSRAERQATQQNMDRLLAEAQAYLKTPDGNLVWAYQHFQIIQLCHDLRKDFAVKFIGISDYNDYRIKIKSLETKLKPSLTQKNVDVLYSTAEERNRNFQPFFPTLIDKVNGIDLFKTITDASRGSDWLNAKKDCDSNANNFRQIIDSNLGPETVKKNF